MSCLAATPLSPLSGGSSRQQHGPGRPLPGSSASLIGRQSHPSDTGHNPLEKQTLLRDALDRNKADDVTAATVLPMYP